MDIFDKFVEFVENLICGLGFLFAIGSSTYCMNLILKHCIDPKHDFRSMAFIICMIIIGIIINKFKKVKEKQ